MAVDAFLTFFDKADGESNQKGHEKRVQLLGWDWGSKPSPAGPKAAVRVSANRPGTPHLHVRLNRSSNVAHGYICTGRAFPKIQLDVTRVTGTGKPEAYFVMTMSGAFVTKISLAASDEGQISQRIELIFKTVAIDYKAQDPKTGALAPPRPSIGTSPPEPRRLLPSVLPRSSPSMESRPHLACRQPAGECLTSTRGQSESCWIDS